MKCNFLFVLLLVQSFLIVNAQQIESPDFSDLLPEDKFYATPDVMAFQKFNTLPVDLYSGKIKTNLVLFQVTSGNISFPISLSYNPDGVKVDNIASNVGLGWNLNASGNIVKVVKGFDDLEHDSAVYAEIDWDHGAIPWRYLTKKGYHLTYQEWRDTDPEHLGPGNHGLYAEDPSPDLFIANAPNLSSKFILDKVSLAEYNITPIDGSGITNSQIVEKKPQFYSRIGFLNEPMAPVFFPELLNLGHSAFDRFRIKDINGFEYTFDVKDTHEFIPRSKVDILQGKIGYRVNTNTWHLSKIEDVGNGGNPIRFFYEAYQKPTTQFSRAITDISLKDHANPDFVPSLPLDVFGHIPDFDIHDPNDDTDEKYMKSSVTLQKSGKVNRIKKITYQGGIVEFIYGLPRIDDPDEEALTEIWVKNISNNIIKRFILEYSYFNSKEGCSEAECKRLRLDKIREVDSNSSLTIDLYSFDYEYANPLPKRHSLQQDFLGFYNNNGVTTPPFDSFERKKPTLYFQKSKSENSITPFPLSNYSSLTIPGDYSLEPNNYSRSGLLKSIEYSSGGKSEFEYELHQFNLLGATYNSGGMRIKKQLLTDENGTQKKIEYEYVDSQDESSGYINKLPVFGFPWMRNRNLNSNNVSFIVYDKNKSALELTNGSFVGYSRVIEKEVGNGYTVHEFVSPETAPNTKETFVSYEKTETQNNPTQTQAVNFLLDNSAYPSTYYIDNDILRGKTKNVKTFNENDELLTEGTFTYTKNTFSSIPLNYRVTLSDYIEPNGSGPAGQWNFYFSSNLNIERNVLVAESIKDYTGGITSEVITNYQYDQNLPLLDQVISDNGMDEYKTDFYYSFSPEVANEPYVGATVGQTVSLQSQNRLSELIMKKTYKNNNLISREKNNYDNFLGSQIAIKNRSFAKGLLGFEEDIIVTKRDALNNILEYKDQYNVSNVIIWGYSDLFPIAKITNTTYSSISPTLIADLKHASTYGTEADVINYIDQLRALLSLENSEITNYIRKPLIGIVSIIDPRGYKTNYEYDTFNRLIRIRDSDNKIIEEYDYNLVNMYGSNDPIPNNPISAYLGIPSIDENNNTLTYSIPYVTGGSGAVSYDWNIISGAFSFNNDTDSSYTISYDCFQISDRVEIECIITDVNDPSNTITLSRNDHISACPELVSASSMYVTEVRQGEPNEDFIGIMLTINDVTGGSGNFDFHWQYSLDGTNYSTFINTNDSELFVSENYSGMSSICNMDVDFICTITDINTSQVFNFNSPFSKYVDCNDTPQ